MGDFKHMASNLLQNVYLFKELTPQELEQVNGIATLESKLPGDEIFSEGDSAHSLYVIKHGSVKIQHTGVDNQIHVATLGTGSHFGEMAFVDGEKRSATVTTIERADIVRLEFDGLKKLLEKNPPIAVKVYKALAHFLCGRLRVTTNDLTFAREKNMHHF